MGKKMTPAEIESAAAAIAALPDDEYIPALTPEQVEKIEAEFGRCEFPAVPEGCVRDVYSRCQCPACVPAAVCPVCGCVTCYAVCPNSPDYYSPEREREDDAWCGW